MSSAYGADREQQAGTSMVSPENAGRSLAYAELLRDLAARGECPLDPHIYFELTPAENVLRRTGGWILGKASVPYENTEQEKPDVTGHMLLFPERHIVSPDEMTGREQRMFWKMCKIARDDFGAATGAVVLRYSTEGQHAAVGASIAHIHAHLVVPHLEPETGRVPGAGTPDAEVVTVRIG